MKKQASAVVVSDLDGTLLADRDHSFEGARPALAALRSHRIPLLLVSSKTRAEMESLREELGIHDPFVVENGGAGYWPRGYFPPGRLEGQGEYEVLRRGVPYLSVVDAFRRARQATGARIKGFSDVGASEVARLTGLSLDEARRARQREFDEPFWVEGPEDDKTEKAMKRLAAGGLTVTRGGRFYHLLGECDKGRAVRELLDLYRERRPARADEPLVVAGLGDAVNDLPFLVAVDRAYIVAGSHGRHDPELTRALPDARRVGPAPHGWAEGVMDFLAWLEEQA
ncbi:MAG: HAD-IIB family hydrolase [Acidobacteriota bacterium]